MEVLSQNHQYIEGFNIHHHRTAKSKGWSSSTLMATTAGDNLKRHYTRYTIVNQNFAKSDVVKDKQDKVEKDEGGHDEEKDEGKEENVNFYYFCDNAIAIAVSDLSLRLLNELRAAKRRNLACAEVSIPCDLTTHIANDIIRMSEREPGGIRGCTIYINFEMEMATSLRRIGMLKLETEMVSTFEVYLTLRQDKRGWTAILPQFMKSLSRSITISPEYTLTKHKLYTSNEAS